MPAFTCMSTHPGIGAAGATLQRLVTDKVYRSGRFIKLPRYYLDLLEKIAPDDVENVRQWRKWKAETFAVTETDLAARRKKYNIIFKIDLDKRTRSVLQLKKRRFNSAQNLCSSKSSPDPPKE